MEPNKKLNASESASSTSGALSFRTAYNFGDTKKYSQDLSREIEDLYELDENGEPVKTGETNVYEQIQVSKEECEIYNILKRYDAGDLSVIKDPNEGAVFADFSNMPTNVLDSMANMDKAIANWNSLPKGVRELFGNDVSKFMKASPEDISSALNTYADSIAKKKPEEDGGEK